MRVLSVGECTLDQIGIVERFAEAGAAVEMPTFSIQGGGTAATAAVALVRWGAEVRFIGKTATDERGALIERTLSGEGVDTRGMIREGDRISQVRFVVIESSTKESHTYFTPGNVGELEIDEIDVDLLEGVDLLLIDGNEPRAQMELMRKARERGIPVLLEACGDREIAAECVGMADVVVVSERRASEITGMGALDEICRGLLEKGPKTAIVTLGNEGAVGLSRDAELVRVGPCEVEVVDRTGAGDIFLGAVALALLEGWEVERMVGFANCAAGLSCRGLGSRSGIPGREEIEKCF